MTWTPLEIQFVSQMDGAFGEIRARAVGTGYAYIAVSIRHFLFQVDHAYFDLCLGMDLMGFLAF